MPRTMADPTPDTVCDAMRVCEPHTAAELAESFDIGRRSMLRRLDRLADDGRVERKDFGGRRVVYWRGADD